MKRCAPLLRRVAVFLAPPLLVATTFALALAIEPRLPPQSASPALEASRAEHVGAAACAICHAPEHRDWLGSHHARAMQLAGEATVRAPFAGESAAHFGRESRFFRRDGRFLALTDGPDGRTTEFEVTHTFGVAPLQQYLVPFPGGRLQPLPWAWDTRPAAQGGQRWFHLYPDENITHSDPLHWTARIQTWNLQCATCHSTDLRKGFDRHANGYATTAATIGVSCEACHGAGARHVAWARGQGRPEDAVTKGLAVHYPPNGGAGRWVMEPGGGTARWEGPPRATPVLEVCAPCHSRRREISPERAPGQAFLDGYAPALLDAGLYHADGAMLDEVFEWGSFVQSRMFRAGVVCTDCHRPHSARLRAEGNALCLQCHAAESFDTAAHHRHAQGSTGAQCMACHMPQRTYMVVHARRDHSLRVPRPDLSAELGTPDACTDCHRDRDAAWASARVAAWHGEGRRREPHWGATLAAGRAAQRGAGERLLALAADQGAPGIARATALTLLPRNPAPGLLAALASAVRDPDPLVRMAAAGAFGALPPGERALLAAPLLDDPIRAVRLEAVRVLGPVPAAALAPVQREALARAMTEYVAAARHNADQPEPLANLGSLYAEQGRPAEAEAEYRAALRVDAAYAAAHFGLAEVLRRAGRESEAEAVLRGGIAAAPEAAALHHGLGLSLVRQRRLGEALAALARAVELDPGNMRFAYVHGVALNSAGRSREAFDALRAALARHPGARDILLLLALIARDQGATALARGYAEQVLAIDPEDREARQLLSTLQRRR
jgi:predicted CXXCH cytochrome family protein